MHTFHLDMCFICAKDDTALDHIWTCTTAQAALDFPSGFPSMSGCGTAVGTFWPKLKHYVLKHLELNCFRVAHIHLTSWCISFPGARVNHLLHSHCSVDSWYLLWHFLHCTLNILTLHKEQFHCCVCLGQSLEQLLCIQDITSLCHHQVFGSF